MICDFCSAPVPDIPEHSYSAQSFECDGTHVDGNWAACDACAALVDADDRPALARRSCATYFVMHPAAVTVISEQDMLLAIGNLQRKFFAHRIAR